MRRWINELGIGARMALGGGRSGLVRALLTAVGVGLGVAALLAAVSIPTMMQARNGRGAARDDVSFGTQVSRSDSTILVGMADSAFGDASLRGRLLQPDGAHPPVPPGVMAIPAAGTMVVSPALRTLLNSPDGALLRQRLNYPIVGTIGDNGLIGPAELAFYLGTTSLVAGDAQVERRDHFGEATTSDGLDPVLLLLVVVIFVVLLVPVGIFVAAAIRFGGDSRDRRLAGARLVGADRGMAHRIAAGEALLSAVLGLVVGAVMFFVGRSLVGSVTIVNFSAFPADLRPNPGLAVLIALVVPAAAIGVTILSLRRVVIEPLGVLRRGRDAKRRLWWRLVVPVLGLVLLAPLIGDLTQRRGSFNTAQVVAGIVLLLIGVATLLPWLVQATVQRFRGGSVSWQLAVRRLQLDGATSARAVTGIAVAVAGAIGLQMMFGAVSHNYYRPTGEDATKAQLETVVTLHHGWSDVETATSSLRKVPGVTSVISSVTMSLTLPAAVAGGDAPITQLTVADCSTLTVMAVISHCADGDVFLLPAPYDGGLAVPPGTATTIGDEQPVAWRVPATARTVVGIAGPNGTPGEGVLATPGAVTGVDWSAHTVVSYLQADATVPDVADHVRNALWRLDPVGSVNVLRALAPTDRFASIQRGLFVGSVVVLLLIGASLLVTTLEHLRDRRKLLATLVAFGTRRSTIAWSILWQAAVPVSLGLILATAAGLALGSVLLKIVSENVTVDWTVVVGMAGVAAAVVLLVTALSLPVLWRIMRPDGLRTE